MIGENAYLGENARFAKVGSEAWGEATEESGTVLFDGVLNFEAGEDGYMVRTSEVEIPWEETISLSVTINGTELTSTIEAEAYSGKLYDDGKIVGMISNQTDSSTRIIVAEGYAHEGENTVKIVQTD